MNTNGLTDEEVVKSREKYGTNSLTKKESDTFFKLLIETLGDPIIKILLIALGIKVIFLIKDFDWYETIGIVIAIFIASFISSISEYGSSKAFKRLQEESSLIKCLVIRNKKVVEIPIDEVVVGDVVKISSGEKVCADGTIIEGTVSVDESVLNGESKEKELSQGKAIYRGTIITSGEGKFLVQKVGDSTYYGHIASELQIKEEPSVLKQRLSKLAKNISTLGYGASIIVALSYLFNKIVIQNNFDLSLIIKTITNYKIMLGYILHSLTLAVTLIVVAVPEGLPMMITLVLSSNMKRMLKDNVLVRRLVGIETSGNLNILFTDKTGTLTNGRMDVIGILDCNNKEYSNLIELTGNYKNLIKDSLIYNNDSVINKDKILGGNITDKAILRFCNENKDSSVKIINKIEFNSQNKYAVSLIERNNKQIKLIKGAPEIIIDNCSKYYNNHTNNIEILDRKKVTNYISKYTSAGIRVIALAISDNKYSLNYLKNSTLLGFVLLKDEVRTDAKEAVNRAQSAHIQVVMMTGDNKDTAYSIAKEVGIITSKNDLVITSEELNKMTDEDIKINLENIKVIARALPTDKSRMVRLSQELSLVVGMTGDGVNDAPALKKADVGFAMGSGTEVSKEASDIVILDNRFTSITNAILYGRTVFKSIRKFIICQLTINLCTLLVSIIGPFIGVPVPVTVIQMLWINMIMDTLSGLAFSYEPVLLEYMEEYPKSKNENIINKYMLNEILITGIYSTIVCLVFLKSNFIKSFYRIGPNNEYVLTAFFGLLIFISIFNSFNARTHRLNILANILNNKAFIGIMGFVICMQVYLIYFGGSLFRTSGLQFKEFIVMFTLALSIIPLDFIRKLIYRKTNKDIGV